MEEDDGMCLNLFYRRRSPSTQILVRFLQRLTVVLYDSRLLSCSSWYWAEHATRSLRFRTMVNSDTGSGGWVELSDERIEVRIERGLIADGQSARQATARPRSVSCCWQNVGRERLGLGSGWCKEGEAVQIHVIPHRAAREVLAKFSASLPSHTIRVVCGNDSDF